MQVVKPHTRSWRSVGVSGFAHSTTVVIAPISDLCPPHPDRLTKRPFDETRPTPTRQPASVGRFGSRELVSKSKSHSWPARREFVRLPDSPHRLLVPPAKAQPSNPDAGLPSDRPGTFPGGRSFFRSAHRIGMCWKAQPLRLSFPTTHRLQPRGQEFRPFAVVRPRLSPYHNHGPSWSNLRGALQDRTSSMETGKE